MTLQHIRHYYEQPIVDWCATNAVELRADNMIDPGSDAASEFLVTRFNFGQFTEQTLCGAIENAATWMPMLRKNEYIPYTVKNTPEDGFWP